MNLAGEKSRNLYPTNVMLIFYVFIDKTTNWINANGIEYLYMCVKCGRLKILQNRKIYRKKKLLAHI